MELSAKHLTIRVISAKRCVSHDFCKKWLEGTSSLGCSGFSSVRADYTSDCVVREHPMRALKRLQALNLRGWASRRAVLDVA